MKLEGFIAAPFTPLHEDGSVALERLEELPEFLQRNGCRGAFVCGTTGEGVLLSVAERKAVTERWITAAPAGLEVIVHVGHESLEESKALAAHAQERGAAAIGAMPPTFFKPQGAEGLARHCQAIAAAAPELPFYYYHIPVMTHAAVPMLDFLRAAGPLIPNLAGVKYTDEDLMDFARCQQLEGGRYDLLFGRDEILLAALALGARGAIGSTYNYAAPLYRRIVEAFDAGDLDAARALQYQAMELVDVLHRFGGQACGKAIMSAAWREMGPCRPPIAGLSAEQRYALQVELERIGFFEYCSR
jgi:N-acetylneuraminate lyase